jgi:hypothetical protein
MNLQMLTRPGALDELANSSRFFRDSIKPKLACS